MFLLQRVHGSYRQQHDDLLVQQLEFLANQQNRRSFLRRVAEEEQRGNLLENKETGLRFDVSRMNRKESGYFRVSPITVKLESMAWMIPEISRFDNSEMTKLGRSSSFRP